MPKITSDQLGRVAASVAQQISRDFPEPVQVAISILPDSSPLPGGAISGNCAGLAYLAWNIVRLALQEPRPTDCEKCAAAWDRLQAADLALTPTQEVGRC